jgi:hypothetical protein
MPAVAAAGCLLFSTESLLVASPSRHNMHVMMMHCGGGDRHEFTGYHVSNGGLVVE